MVAHEVCGSQLLGSLAGVGLIFFQLQLSASVDEQQQRLQQQQQLQLQQQLQQQLMMHPQMMMPQQMMPQQLMPQHMMQLMTMLAPHTTTLRLPLH